MLKASILNIQKPQTKDPALQRATSILEHGIDTANSLLRIYNEKTQNRGPGAPTHEEQDLLRAMVLMAGAALDAALKRLLTDAYSLLLAKHPAVHEKAAEHIHRNVLKRITEKDGLLIAQALLSESSRGRLTDYIVEDLTSHSLQSVQEVARLREYLGLPPLRKDTSDSLKRAIETRNQIAHEMDAVDESAPKPGSKKRRQRKKDEMIEFAEVLLKVCAETVREVDDRLLAGR